MEPFSNVHGESVPGINGLILAGGKSARMGWDKSLMVIHNQPQRLHLFAVLKPFCQNVYLSCKHAQSVPSNLNPIPDRYEADSPLNGILSAFDQDPNSAWLTVAVDMPLIDHGTVAFLIKHRDPTKSATCFTDSEGSKPEPLLTIWEPSCLSFLHAFHKNGNISPRDFLLTSDINLLAPPDKTVLTNINSEEELWKFSQKNK
jgi:molybdopterin-guanine dinucleotide biosynthesis protein A